MNDTIRSTAIAILATIAISLAAATLSSTVTPESGDPGTGIGPSSGDGGLLPVPRGAPVTTPTDPLRIPYLTEVLLLIVAIGALVTLAYVLMNRREALRTVIAAVTVVVIILVLFWLFSSPNLPTPPRTGTPNGSILGGGGGGESGGTETNSPSVPSMLLLFVLGLALIGTVVTLFRTTNRSADETSPDAEIETTDAAAVGRVAGRAADRIEDETDLDNQVYRAWREMTDLLEMARPETSTPGEFAAAAVDAGMARSDVSELTRLFEDVRYGGTDPSNEDEQRALTIFRHIENEYVEDEP